MRQRRPEVPGPHTVQNAKVSLMRFRFNGIPVDRTYAQLHVTDTVEAGLLHCQHFILN
jgi:poly(A) polymerase